jgi:hypothetical protein
MWMQMLHTRGMTIQVNPMRAALASEKGPDRHVDQARAQSRNPHTAKSAGLDYARLDMQHSSPSIETVVDMAVLLRRTGTSSMS